MDALRSQPPSLVVYHYAEQAPISLFQVHPAFERGTRHQLSCCFRASSGHRYGPRLTSGGGALQFLGKRLARIYPAHLVMARSSSGCSGGERARLRCASAMGRLVAAAGPGLSGPACGAARPRAGTLTCRYGAGRLLRVFPSPGACCAPSGRRAVLAAASRFRRLGFLTLTLLGFPGYQMPLQSACARLPSSASAWPWPARPPRPPCRGPLAMIGASAPRRHNRTGSSTAPDPTLPCRRPGYDAVGRVLAPRPVAPSSRPAAISFSRSSPILPRLSGSRAQFRRQLGLPPEAVWAAWAVALPAPWPSPGCSTPRRPAAADPVKSFRARRRP